MISSSRDRDKALRPLVALAPACPKCSGPTKTWMIIPDYEDDLVTYRCPKCKTEIRRSVPRSER
jgi:hypothetical protein